MCILQNKNIFKNVPGRATVQHKIHVQSVVVSVILDKCSILKNGTLSESLVYRLKTWRNIFYFNNNIIPVDVGNEIHVDS